MGVIKAGRVIINDNNSETRFAKPETGEFSYMLGPLCLISKCSEEYSCN